MRLKYIGKDKGVVVPTMADSKEREKFGTLQSVDPGTIFECDAKDGAILLTRFNLKPDKKSGRVYPPKFEEVTAAGKTKTKAQAAAPITD